MFGLTKEALALIRAVCLLVAVALALWFMGDLWDGFRGLLTKPLQTQLDVSLATNEGFKRSAEHQNAGVDSLKKAEGVRKARSAAAAKDAGKAEFSRAEGIRLKPSTGLTPVERAANRINAEFGR